MTRSGIRLADVRPDHVPRETFMLGAPFQVEASIAFSAKGAFTPAPPHRAKFWRRGGKPIS